MISVPDAALLPSTPRPVRWANSSIRSPGKPCGYVGIATGVTMPMSSQWPVVVSLPFDRSRPPEGRAALRVLDVPEAELLEVGKTEPADGLCDVAQGVGPLVAV